MKFRLFTYAAVFALISISCQNKPEEIAGLPAFEIVEGSCPSRANEVSGSCKLVWEKQVFTSANKRYIEFGANLSNNGSRVTIVLNSSNKLLTDGVHITFTRDQIRTLGTLRLSGGIFNMDQSRTQFWEPTSLRIGFDFHPQGLSRPKIHIWRSGNGTQTVASADVSTETLGHFTVDPAGNSASGDISGIILYEATFLGDQYKEQLETKTP